MSRVVGLDLSLTSTGVAIISRGGITVRRIKTRPGTKDPSLADRQRRLHELRRNIWDLARGADLVVIEGPSFGQQRQSGQHDRAGLWWLVVDWLHGGGDDLTTPVAEVPPAIVKKYATGKGNAAKDEVLAAVVRRFPDVDVTGNDEADALVLAAMGARHLANPVDDMPKAHLDALAKVRWPDLNGEES